MLGVLENQALVQEFSQGGAPIEVIAALIPNQNTISGFTWSSAKGPPVQITSGTLCDAWITLTNQRPISFVLPMFRGVTGI
jgi:HlyD family secretion protein